MLEAAPCFEKTLSAPHNNRVNQKYQLIQKTLFDEEQESGEEEYYSNGDEHNR
ncbi:MAG: hypothetical protein NVS4B1_05390 [Ktedonobacteraceae bacterium]